MYHAAADVGQADIAAGMAVGQSFVIEPHLMKDRGMEIRNVGAAIDHGGSELADRPVSFIFKHTSVTDFDKR